MSASSEENDRRAESATTGSHHRSLPERARPVALAFECSNYLKHLHISASLYPNAMDKAEYERLVVELQAILQVALENEHLEGVRQTYEEEEGNHDAADYAAIMAVTILIGCKLAGVDPESVPFDWMGRQARVLVGDELEVLRTRVTELIAFQCKIPNPPEDNQYSTPSRNWHMLLQYWERYESILLDLGRPYLVAVPHPLSRFIAELRFRIRACLKVLQEDALTQALEDALCIEFDVDHADMWGEYCAPRIDYARQRVEERRVKCGSGRFDLTQAELVFLSKLDAAITNHEKSMSKANEEWLTSHDLMPRPPGGKAQHPPRGPTSTPPAGRSKTGSPAKKKELQAAQKKAGASYEWICGEYPDLEPVDPSGKGGARNYGPIYRKLCELVQSGECTIYPNPESLPTMETWKRQAREYLSATREPQGTGSPAKEPGRSIVRGDQI